MWTRVFAIVAVMVAATPAGADPQAEQLFHEGRELITAGKVAEACERFERSQAIEPRVGTALNLGDCRERQGLLSDAWEAFVAARSLSSRDGDDRADEAARRADALAPQLAHLTIAVSGPRAPGLAVTRDGKPIATAALDTDIPFDPGSHEIAAMAPGYLRWSRRVRLSLGAHEVVTVPPMEIDPNAPREPIGTDHVVRVVPAFGHVAAGLAFGGTSDSDIVGGVRLVANYPVPRGAIRATLHALYTRLLDDDMYHRVDLVGTTLGFDYVWAWRPGLASAAGLGVGLDFIHDNFENQIAVSRWAAVRASPVVVRLAAPRIEIGLHVMYVVPANVVVGVLGVDWFVW